ncbi:arabinogalactan endo-1,4-beta-galactosidase [Aeromonas allosaccharophila]|uniref:glycoside hydrolase family 53 protein n=1 Tax=Aeromonas allosaccharophila TaxID=656 RepID=UPI0005B2362A|nr:glycosyl hydrolase 53 family protein [Aeromonas allosaccharophila]OKP45476.1 arabinogalactan endo-1,4-beta-galactosidase [Aeromonas allosaccharophila]
MKLSLISALVLGASMLNPSESTAMVKGADVSWLTQMEQSGYRFYNDSGKQQDLLLTLKQHGINAIRLRVWVNPAGGWNGLNDVIAKAKRAKAAGFDIMIDFHYSDSWADPGKQTKPAAWQGYTFEQLMSNVYWHTYNSLVALKQAGITPKWVQVGNETNNGMLWDDGKASANMRNFAWLINSGYDAVKAVNKSTKVIVHLANCENNALYRWMFDGLKANGAKWDVIGASIYPTQTGNGDWFSMNNRCYDNLADMVSRHGKEVMIVEVGMPWDDPKNSYDTLVDLLNKMKWIPDNKGLGVFYWEPQSHNGWQNYSLGLMDQGGKPTHAMDAFLQN